MPVPPKFAQNVLPRLIKARAAHGLSQRLLALRIGVSEVTVRSWETRRRTPSEDKARRWFGELSVPFPEDTDWFPPTKGPAQCGTRSGYQVHGAADQPACQACNDAQNAYMRAYRRGRR